MKLALALVSFALAGVAHADRIIEQERGDSVNETSDDLVSVRPHIDYIVPTSPPLQELAGVTSNVIFMNRCAGGCAVTLSSNDDSRTNKSAIVSRNGNLGAFPYGDAAWTDVMSCVKATFAPFNVVITDADPGSASHLEIMTGTTPQSLGFDAQTGGVAPFYCEAYQSNALVFDFAGIWGSGTTCNAQCVTNICATAAQEIAHTWSLDHVIDPSDPMTYYGQNVVAQRRFKNAANQCGSDCVGGRGPMNETCSGAQTQNHACACTGAQTQNDFQAIVDLFGAAAPTPPTVAVTLPKDGAQVVAGFPVHADAMDTDGVAKVELRIDGALIGSLAVGPYAYNAPATIGDGTHHVEVTAYDVYGASAKSAVDVIIGKPCDDSNPCANSTDVCAAGKCIPGSGVAGGLGTPCTDNTQCTSGTCASGNQGQVCVINCESGGCPSGYGCAIPTGAAAGVCYPGVDDGSGGGGCSASQGQAGMLLMLGALLVTRRRKRLA